MLARVLFALTLFLGTAGSQVAQFNHAQIAAQLWDPEYVTFVLQDGTTHTATRGAIAITPSIVRIQAHGGDAVIWILPGHQLLAPTNPPDSIVTTWTDTSGFDHSVTTNYPPGAKRDSHRQNETEQKHKRRLARLQLMFPVAPR